MNRQKEKLESLVEEFPHLFPKHAETGEPCFYFQCSDGWYYLIKTLLSYADQRGKNWERNKEIQRKYESQGQEVPDYVTNYLDKNPKNPLEDWELHQVKEKFGGLRFYSSWLDDQFRGAVSFAEDMSYVICEECGDPGKLYRKGWMVTSCERHMPDYAKPKKITDDSKVNQDLCNQGKSHDESKCDRAH